MSVTNCVVPTKLCCFLRSKRGVSTHETSPLGAPLAPAHNALGIREFLAKNNIAILEQPPYYPDQAPCDFFLFSKLKEVIKGTRFQDSESIETAVTRELQAISEEPSRSEWKNGRGDWKRAFEPKEVTLKATCCKIY